MADPAITRFGRYELLRPLGRGGMAEVFLARLRGPEGVEKRLVIKKVLPELARDQRFLDLFVAEARVSMSLAHGNIVPVFDFGREGADYFLAMEYVPGRDLDALLTALGAAGRRLDAVLAAYVVAEVCRALDHAHRARDGRGRPMGLVHRDVTPRNVLLSWDGEVKLADFGVSRVGAPGATRLRGTFGYMAPEQARGEAVDGRTDSFALGLILREALTGVRARPGADAAAVLEAARRAELPPLPEAAPPALAAIAVRASAREPEERFADAAQMQAALEDYLAAARPATKPSRALAALLGELFPGVAAVELAGARPAGARTQLSQAGTASDDAPAPAPPTARGPRRVILVGAAVALAAAGAVLAVRCSAPAPRGAPAPRPAFARPPASSPSSAPRPGAVAAALPPASAPARASSSARAASAPARRPPTGTLDLNCVPWCEAVIDGHRVGESPLTGLALPAGRHRLRVHNPQLKVTRTRVIDIRAGEVNRQRVDLTAE